MPFVDIRGRQLHDVEHGTGQPIVFGTSYLWDADMWMPQAPASVPLASTGLPSSAFR
jgi:hypothetical protein